jgi:hypothetical protein
MNEIAKIEKSELSQVENNLLNKNQLNFLFAPTPEKHRYTRPAKGGGKWTYVTGTYVKKVLNLMFGWNWSFEIVDEQISVEFKQVIVKGRLTVNANGSEIVKMQFGRQDIKFKKNTELPLDLGNDLKGATTDALKKCASELGIAADVYAPNEFKQIRVVDEEDQLPDLLPGTDNWKNALKALANGTTILQIEKKFNISEEIRMDLLSEAAE